LISVIPRLKLVLRPIEANVQICVSPGRIVIVGLYWPFTYFCQVEPYGAGGLPEGSPLLVGEASSRYRWP